MARSRIAELAQRRELLVARAQSQREELAYYVRQFHGPVRVVGAVYGLGQTLGRSPLLITGLAALLMKTPWRRLARVPRWAWRGWKILQLFRGARG
jgi:hypothetical protein